MKKFTKVIALILSLTLLLCFPTGVSAAEPEGTGADTAAKGSLTIYKVDLTSAEKDGAWDSSYVSTVRTLTMWRPSTASARPREQTS